MVRNVDFVTGLFVVFFPNILTPILWLGFLGVEDGRVQLRNRMDPSRHWKSAIFLPSVTETLQKHFIASDCPGLGS